MRGTADLPLHGGKAPPWLFKRMVSLAKGICEVMVFEYGQRGFLERLSDPFWFQSLSCVLGFDWHSSGTTTVSTGALKEAIDPGTLGIAVAGGKGKASLKTPVDIMDLGTKLGLTDAKLTGFQKISRLSAKVDNALVQDSFQLYHHTFFMTEQGHWAVIQQGMNTRYARRYHWFEAEDLIQEPHRAIMGDRFGEPVLDLTSRESQENRSLELDLVRDGPGKLERLFSELEVILDEQRRRVGRKQTTLRDWEPGGIPVSVGQRSEGHGMKEGSSGKPEFAGNDDRIDDGGPSPELHVERIVDRIERGERKLVMPMHINWEAVREAYEFVPNSYEELISVRGVGPSTVRSLALIGELIYGTEASWRDPVKFSFTVGGKDGVPYPVDRQAMDASIEIISSGIHEAKTGDKEKLKALERLRRFVPEDR